MAPEGGPVIYATPMRNAQYYYEYQEPWGVEGVGYNEINFERHRIESLSARCRHFAFGYEMQEERQMIQENWHFTQSGEYVQ